VNSFERILKELKVYGNVHNLAEVDKAFAREFYIYGLRRVAEMISNAEYYKPTPLSMLDMIKSEIKSIEGNRDLPAIIDIVRAKNQSWVSEVSGIGEQMKPTLKFRWLLKPGEIGTLVKGLPWWDGKRTSPTHEAILQQWWEEELLSTTKDVGEEIKGEWRDVPIEK
jgi:hypothetical protein